MRALFAVLIVALLVPSVAAQDPDAPPWAPDATLLYLDSNDAANGDAENTGFLSTIQDAGDDAALGPSSACDTHSGNSDVDFTAVPPANDVDLTHTFHLDPAQAGTATLAEGIEAKLYIGAGTCYGEVDLAVRLVSGDVLAAQGSVAGHRYNDASGNYPLATIPLTIESGAVDVAQMRLEVQITGKNGGSTFMGIGSSRGFSTIDIPLASLEVAEAPEPIHEDLQGEAIALSWAFNGTQSFTYNWTAPESLLNISVAGDISEGGVQVRAVAPDGVEIINETLAGMFDQGFQAEPPAGLWTIRVDAVDAIGNMTLVIDAVPEGDGHDDAMDHDDNMDGNATDAPEAGEAGKDSPGLGLVAVLGAIAIALRRRQ